MIKITHEIEDNLIGLGHGFVGYISEFGAVVGDVEFIIYYKDGEDEDIPYLAHISEFEQQGVLIKLKSS